MRVISFSLYIAIVIAALTNVCNGFTSFRKVTTTKTLPCNYHYRNNKHHPNYIGEPKVSFQHYLSAKHSEDEKDEEDDTNNSNKEVPLADGDTSSNPSFVGRIGNFVKPSRKKIRRAAKATLAAVALAGTAGAGSVVQKTASKGIARTVAVGAMAAGAGSAVAIGNKKQQKQQDEKDDENEEETLLERPLPQTNMDETQRPNAEQEALKMMEQAEQARSKADEALLGKPTRTVVAVPPNDFMTRKPPFASKTIGASMGLGGAGGKSSKDANNIPKMTDDNIKTNKDNEKSETYQSLLEECIAMENRIKETNEKLKRLEERELRAKQIIEQQEAAMEALTKKADAATSVNEYKDKRVLMKNESDRQLMQSIKDARIAKAKAQEEAISRAKAAKINEQNLRSMLNYRLDMELRQKERAKEIELQQRELVKAMKRKQIADQKKEQSLRAMLQYRLEMETRIREELVEKQKLLEMERRKVAEQRKEQGLRSMLQYRLEMETSIREKLAEKQKLLEMMEIQKEQRKVAAQKKEKGLRSMLQYRLDMETRIRQELAEKQKLLEIARKKLDAQKKEQGLRSMLQFRLDMETRIRKELAEKERLQELVEKRALEVQAEQEKLQEEARMASIKAEKTARSLLEYRLELYKRTIQQSLAKTLIPEQQQDEQQTEESVPFFALESEANGIASSTMNVVIDEDVKQKEIVNTQKVALGDEIQQQKIMSTSGVTTDDGLEQKEAFGTQEVDIDEGATVVEDPVKLELGSFVIPHPDKVSFGGEDAVFVKGSTFGVFDGVTGAEKVDGMPLYSKTMATEMESNIGEEGLTIDEITDIMTDAAEVADSTATGATTAIVASITNDGFLQALNLGDSRCCVIRDNEVVAKTDSIVHFFNCPYQLCEYGDDRPEHGTKLDVPILCGDMIVMGSDGLFDNVSEKSICNAIRDMKYASCEFISEYLAYLAQEISFDENAVTPNALEWRENGIPDCVGGKLDDISCIVVRCS